MNFPPYQPDTVNHTVTYQGNTFRGQPGGEWVLVSGNGGSGGNGPNIPPFNFDWDQAEKEALEKLRPYYEKKLAEAQGDVNLAKTRMEEDYQQGIRYNAEDEKTQLAADAQTATEETNTTKENLNKRGLLFGEMDQGQQESAAPISPFAQKFELTPMAQKQDARKLAIQRAIQRSNESLATTKSRGVEDQDIALGKTKTALNNEKSEKAVLSMAPLKYQQEYTKYQATVGKSLNPYLQQ